MGHKKMDISSFITIEKVVRLDASKLYTDKEIAAHLQISQGNLRNLRAHPYYEQTVRRIASGVGSKYDAALIDTDYAVNRLKEMLPLAIDALHDTLQQKSDPKLRFTAAMSIFDREGQLAEVKRIGGPTEAQNATVISERDNAIADSLISAFKKQKDSGDENGAGV